MLRKSVSQTGHSCSHAALKPSAYHAERPHDQNMTAFAHLLILLTRSARKARVKTKRRPPTRHPEVSTRISRSWTSHRAAHPTASACCSSKAMGDPHRNLYPKYRPAIRRETKTHAYAVRPDSRAAVERRKLETKSLSGHGDRRGMDPRMKRSRKASLVDKTERIMLCGIGSAWR
jgi:hypothetical protein